jgi:predicted  nucleic acid-binding Zn-ribbon protein
MALYAYYVPSNQVKLYANKLSQKTYKTDVPTLLNEVEVLKDRIRRRDQDIADLKSRNSRLEDFIAQIRRFVS